MPPCGSQPDAALCSDEDWGSKCPSGCRVQGLILQRDREMNRNLREVCQKAERYEKMVQKSTRLLTDVCTEHLQVMLNRQKSDLTTLQDAEKVAKNLMSLQERMFRLFQQVDELSGHAHKQLGSLSRAEVDLDIKLRACAGSCRSVEPFSADHDGYRALEADVEQLDRPLSRRWSTAKPPNGIPQIRLLHTGFSSPQGGVKLRRELLMQLQVIGQKLMVLDPPPEQH